MPNKEVPMRAWPCLIREYPFGGAWPYLLRRFALGGVVMPNKEVCHGGVAMLDETRWGGGMAVPEVGAAVPEVGVAPS